jgi:hypothetical protein
MAESIREPCRIFLQAVNSRIGMTIRHFFGCESYIPPFRVFAKVFFAKAYAEAKKLAQLSTKESCS